MAGQVMMGSVDVFFTLGILLILYGLVMVAVERLNGMPLFFGLDQNNGVINSFVCLGIGVVLISRNIGQGIVHFVIVAAVSAFEYHFFKGIYLRKQQ